LSAGLNQCSKPTAVNLDFGSCPKSLKTDFTAGATSRLTESLTAQISDRNLD
jgi:hypothetical protein